MESKTLQILLKLKDEASKALGNTGKSFNSFNKQISGAKDASNKFALALTGVTTAGVIGGFKMSEVAGKYNSVKNAFGSMTKDMGFSADEFESKVSDASRGTLDKLTILQQGTRALSLMGADSFDNFEGQFAQLAEYTKKASRATGQDMDYLFNSLISGMSRESKMLLDNLGINVNVVEAKKLYAESLGKEVDELTKTESKHAVLNATLKELEGTFGDVSATSGGFSGAMAQLKATMTNAQITIGQEVVPAFNELVRAITPLIVEYVPKLIQLTKDTINFFRENKEAIVLLSGVILGALTPSIYASIKAFTLLSLRLLPYMIGGAIIAGLIAGIWFLVKNWDEVSVDLVTMWETLQEKFGEFFENIAEKAVNVFNGIKETIKGSINWIIDRINWFINKANQLARSASVIPGVNLPMFANIPRLANGGIVNKPTVAMIGEAGPEAIVPLKKEKMSSGGVNVNITVNGDVSGRELVDMVTREIMRNLKLATKL